MTSNDLVRVYDSGTPESREWRGDGAGDVALGALFPRRACPGPGPHTADDA